MNKFESDVFWITEKGEKVFLKDMSNDHVNRAFQIIQKRQIVAYSKLEFLTKLEEAFKAEAKSRKFKLIELDEQKGHEAKKFRKLKMLIKATINCIKRNNKKNEKEAETVLQETT